jgi:hypothetical protein
MKIQMSRTLALALFALAGVQFSLPVNATSEDKSASDTGQLRVIVTPEEAYIWVDDKAASHRTTTLKLTPGEHKITVYNYGYQPETRKVNMLTGQRDQLTVNLKPAGKPVSGPWGRIQIEGVHGDALVFLNGTTPEFFVGHVDEMNNHIFSEQQLIVPVGKHQVHVLANKAEKEIWAGTVEVKENERVVIYTKNPPDEQFVYKRWPEGEKLGHLKRFDASTSTATIAVAPVQGKLAVSHNQVKCDEPVTVSWDSTDAANTIVKANENPLGYARNGAVETRPRQTTKYEFHAAGPGGIVNSDATVNVDTTVKTSLAPAASELRYVKVGDKVQEQGTTELKWKASNANSIKIDPVGTVTGADGNQTIQPRPQRSSPGPIDETVTYKITATNVCGGEDTSVASVHLTGSIEPLQVAAAEPPPLPDTASPLPLLGILGLVFLGAAGILRRTRMK